MVFVNFLGGLLAVHPVLLHHHTYISYADTIMPQFLFAVGFGMRISFCSRLLKEGAYQTYSHFAKRCLGLILLGVVVYHLTGDYKTWASLSSQNWGEFLVNSIKRGPFEALTHIGVTSLWVLPVIGKAGWIRFLFAAVSAILHITLSYFWYYDWNMTPPVGIDGGPLGFLTWTIPLIAGSLAHDLVVSASRPVLKLLLLSFPLMVLGVWLSLANNPDATFPFQKPASEPLRNYWLASQRAGSVTYLLFGAGFAMLVYSLFRLICDHWKASWELFNILGRNALAAYLIHDMVAGAVKPFCPKDSPLWWVVFSVSLYLGIVILFLRHLDRNRLWLKL
jgi:hypothetical protein